MIVPDVNGGGRLYQSSICDGVYRLHVSTLSSVNPKSKLVVSQEHVQRLQSSLLYIIVSSLSGAGLALTAFSSLLQPLIDLFSLTPAVHQTTSKTSHLEFIKSITMSSDLENILVIFGGDTMIYDIINGLAMNNSISADSRITIVLVPCGTGNALATSLGTYSIPTGIGKLFGVCETSVVETKVLPTFRVTIKEPESRRLFWGVVVCSWGLHASLVADSNDPDMRREYGPKRFAVITHFSGV